MSMIRFPFAALRRAAASALERAARALAVPAVLMLLAAPAAHAGDPVAGMALYNNIPDAAFSCSNQSCHGPSPNDNIHGLQKAGNNPGVILTAIKMGVQQMMFLNGLLNPFQLDDIAAYLAPQPLLSDLALDFGTVEIGNASAAQTVTLSDPGGVDLVVTAVTPGGVQVGDFEFGGTCAAGATLAAALPGQSGGTCTLTIRFRPGGTGARSASVTLAYAGATTYPAQQTITLGGTGSPPPAPAASVSPQSLDYGSVALFTAAATRSVVVASTGTVPLHVTGIALAGANVSDFQLSGACTQAALPLALAPGANCELAITFTARAVDLRRAELVISHDGAGSPAQVPLEGRGVATTCPPPAPPRQTQVLACAAGQAGALTQARDPVCADGGWDYGPWVTVADTCSSLPAADLELVEFHNSLLDHYFITASPAERQAIDTGAAGPGWTRTGTLGRVWSGADSAAIVPVCRFYGNPAVGADGRRLGPNSHFYTIDPTECAAVRGDAGWIFEGDVFAAVAPQAGTCPAPLVPVYRNYNGRFAQNDSNHRYATDPAIVQAMTALGWAPEGTVLCIAPTP